MYEKPLHCEPYKGEYHVWYVSSSFIKKKPGGKLWYVGSVLIKKKLESESKLAECIRVRQGVSPTAAPCSSPTALRSDQRVGRASKDKATVPGACLPRLLATGAAEPTGEGLGATVFTLELSPLLPAAAPASSPLGIWPDSATSHLLLGPCRSHLSPGQLWSPSLLPVHFPACASGPGPGPDSLLSWACVLIHCSPASPFPGSRFPLGRLSSHCAPFRILSRLPIPLEPLRPLLQPALTLEVCTAKGMRARGRAWGQGVGTTLSQAR